MILFDATSRFDDRETAAVELAQELRQYADTDSVVLAIPRGGVPVGYAVAQELHLPLDIALSKKIGHPDNPEFAIGSVSMHGLLLNSSDVPTEYIIEETKRIRTLLRKRYALYRGQQSPLSVAGRNVVIVDDGIATGSTILATIAALREQKPSRIIVAVPVAAPDALEAVREQADETVCLLTPEHFYAVGQFYERFPQLTDDEVMYLLRDAAREYQAITQERTSRNAP